MKSSVIEALEKENWQLKVENVVLQQMSAELNESIIFHCNKCDFDSEGKDAVKFILVKFKFYCPRR